MRTLLEIVESAKDGEMPSHDECYWAMLALDGLLHFESNVIMKLHSKPESMFNNVEFQAEESFKRNKRAFAVSPQDWLGDSFDPSNPKYQAIRRASKGLLNKIMHTVDK